MEKDILEQDLEEDELENDLAEIEKEDLKETPTKQKPVPEEQTETQETYEAFKQPARLAIVNTVNGEIVDFDTENDEGLVKLGKMLLNKLDKIEIASGV